MNKKLIALGAGAASVVSAVTIAFGGAAPATAAETPAGSITAAVCAALPAQVTGLLNQVTGQIDAFRSLPGPGCNLRVGTDEGHSPPGHGDAPARLDLLGEDVDQRSTGEHEIGRRRALGHGGEAAHGAQIGGETGPRATPIGAGGMVRRRNGASGLALAGRGPTPLLAPL